MSVIHHEHTQDVPYIRFSYNYSTKRLKHY